MQINLEISDFKQSKNQIVLEEIKNGDLNLQQNVWRLPPPPDKDTAEQLAKDLARNLFVDYQEVKHLIEDAKLLHKHNINEELTQLILSCLPENERGRYRESVTLLCRFYSQHIITLICDLMNGVLLNPAAEEPVFGLSGTESETCHSIIFREGKVMIESRMNKLKLRKLEGVYHLPGTIEAIAEVTSTGIEVKRFHISNYFLHQCLMNNKVKITEDIAKFVQFAQDVTPQSIASWIESLLLQHFSQTPNREFWYQEAIFSLSELERILKDITTYQNKLQPVIDFFARRCQRILMTDLIYPHSPNSPANAILLGIAQKLQRFFPNLSVLQILMPTVEVLDNIATGTRFAEPLKLHEFIISQDNKRFIEVIPCLEFALDDGDLKHTSLYNNARQGLIKEEAERVIAHTRYTRQFYQTIQRIVQEKRDGTNLGAMLQRLIEDLKRGGAHGKEDGQEMNAGRIANVGIANFSQFLSTLDEDTKTRLFACVNRDGKTFAHYWERLTNPVNYRSVIHCIELIAGGLEGIVQNSANNWLFNFKVTGASSNVTIELLQQRCDKAKEELGKAVEKSDYDTQITSSYGTPAAQEATFIRNFCITVPWSYCIAIFGQERLKRYLSDFKFLEKIYKRLDENACIDFTAGLVATYGKEFLLSTTRGAEGIRCLLGAMPESARSSIIYSFSPQLIRDLPTYIQNAEQLASIIVLLAAANRLAYINTIAPALGAILRNGYDVGYLLAYTEEAEWREVIGKCLSDKALTNKLRENDFIGAVLAPINTGGLPVLLRLLSTMVGESTVRTTLQHRPRLRNALNVLSSERGEVLLKILCELFGDQFFKYLVSTFSELQELLSTLPKTKQATIYRFMQPHLAHLPVDRIALSYFVSSFRGKLQRDITAGLTQLITKTITRCDELADFIYLLDADNRAHFLQQLTSRDFRTRIIGSAPMLILSIKRYVF